jgi:N-acylneuraminate cytidylyltransferase/CMP-N,N'-diacetyllegionaminic acid synthase
MLAIIPARKNSVGIKNKHLKKIKNLKVIDYTFKEAVKSNFIDEIIFTTNDERLKRIAKKYNINYIINRPENLCTDNAKMSDVIIHALNFFKFKNNFLPVSFILLQPTSIFRKSYEIDDSIKIYHSEKSKSLISISETINSSYENVLIKKKKFFFLKKKNIIRQKIKKSYFINGSIYIRDTNDFLITKKLIKRSNNYLLMSKFNSFELDEEFDFNIIKKIF